MNNKIISLIAFVAGAGIGSFVTMKLIEEKYKKIADEEIASVKEMYGKKYEPVEEKQEEEPVTKIDIPVKPDLMEYAKILTNNSYVEEEPDMKKKNKPYVVEPGEFGEMDGYETVSLTYYADHVVEDEYGEVLTDDEVDDLVGEENLTRFGEYENDSVFVRNDATRTDYEILLDMQKWSTLHSANVVDSEDN